MTDKGRDPLAEHPLGGEPALPARGRGKTMSLFPDVSEAPLSPSAAPPGPAPQPAADPQFCGFAYVCSCVFVRLCV